MVRCWIRIRAQFCCGSVSCSNGDAGCMTTTIVCCVLRIFFQGVCLKNNNKIKTPSETRQSDKSGERSFAGPNINPSRQKRMVKKGDRTKQTTDAIQSILNWSLHPIPPHRTSLDILQLSGMARFMIRPMLAIGSSVDGSNSVGEGSISLVFLLVSWVREEPGFI